MMAYMRFDSQPREGHWILSWHYLVHYLLPFFLCVCVCLRARER